MLASSRRSTQCATLSKTDDLHVRRMTYSAGAITCRKKHLIHSRVRGTFRKLPEKKDTLPVETQFLLIFQPCMTHELFATAEHTQTHESGKCCEVFQQIALSRDCFLFLRCSTARKCTTRKRGKALIATSQFWHPSTSRWLETHSLKSSPRLPYDMVASIVKLLDHKMSSHL